MKTIFISRKLSSDSVFKKELEARGFTIHGQSLIKFTALGFQSIPHSDWIFFYSRNAVKYFFRGLEKNGKSVSKHIKWASIGKATAEALQKKVTGVDFVGQGNTLETASHFLKLAEKQKVLFPRAENSRKTIQQLLKNRIEDIDLIVYKNEPKKNIQIPDCKILVFTSPMNVKNYFAHQAFFDDQEIYAIGRTTAKTLVSVGIEEFLIAEEPSEAALVKAILE